MSIFNSVGSLGTANAWVENQDQFQFSFNRDVPAGNLVVVWFATDNEYDIFSESAYGDPTSHRFPLVDTKNNIWAFLAGKTGTACWFLCGPYAVVHCCQLQRTLTTGDVLTFAPWGPGIGPTAAKAVSAWEFTVEEGYGWATTSIPWAWFGENSTGSELNWDVPESREYLALYIAAVDGPVTDTYTPPADGWTAIDRDGSSGHGTDDITVNGSWKIETASHFDAQPTLSPARNVIYMLGAITPAILPPSFPHTPIIDDFNRADEYPIDGGIWAAGFDESGPNESQTTGPSSPGTRLLQILGNEAAANTEPWPVGNAGGQATVEDYVCDDMEVYATISDISSYAMVNLLMHHQGQTDDADASGFSMSLQSTDFIGNLVPGSGIWGALKLVFQGNQGVPSGTGLWLWLDTANEPEPGWRFGFQRFRNFHAAWVDTGSGWQFRGGVYIMSNHNTSGRLGLAIWDPVTRVDDFGGGPTCFIVGTNYRWAERHAAIQRIHTHAGEP